jgi:hypothetical protein
MGVSSPIGASGNDSIVMFLEFETSLFNKYLNHNLFPLSGKFRLSPAVTLTWTFKLVFYSDISNKREGVWGWGKPSTESQDPGI